MGSLDVSDNISFSSTDITCFRFESHSKYAIKQQVANMVRDVSLPPDQPQKFEFPGPQPVSIDVKSHFHVIQKDDYAVAPKTDGVRALVAFMDIQAGKPVHIACAMDRSLKDVYGITINKIPRVLFQGTVLDGEMVRTNDNQAIFLIFDAYIVAGFPQYHKPFYHRLESIQTALVQSYQYTPGDTVAMETKPWIPLEMAPNTRAEFPVDKRFPSDGFVFMPVSDPIISGHHNTFFKLKNREHHTVDFLFKDLALMAFNSESRRHVKAGTLVVGPKQVPPPNNSIVECTLHTFHATPSKRTWQLVCTRPDKTRCNTVFVMDKTLLNIQENLSYDQIRQLKPPLPKK